LRTLTVFKIIPESNQLGMNAGLQDSFNLTWKLALVLHGLAPQSIMESYEIERKVKKQDS
jgi:2-polyprenyl-6-methoxyphenol hydroxylase-like FAD-dependent oxidoreductase